MNPAVHQVGRPGAFDRSRSIRPDLFDERAPRRTHTRQHMTANWYARHRRPRVDRHDFDGEQVSARADTAMAKQRAADPDAEPKACTEPSDVGSAAYHALGSRADDLRGTMTITPRPLRWSPAALRHRIDAPAPNEEERRHNPSTATACPPVGQSRRQERHAQTRALRRHVSKASTDIMATRTHQHLEIVSLRCRTAVHARHVVEDYPPDAGQQWMLFRRDRIVFIAYIDRAVPMAIAVWAHHQGHVSDVYAGQVLRDVA